MSLNPKEDYDVIVIGGGHAGTEAAHAAAKVLSKSGRKTALLSLNPDALVSCLVIQRWVDWQRVSSLKKSMLLAASWE